MEENAAGETMMDRREGGELIEVDIDVRTPTVVLSVRVDDETARQLHRLAKRRGVRVSDVLRDAAIEYAQAGWREGESSFEVSGLDVRVSIGQRGVSSHASGRMTIKSDQDWTDSYRTDVTVAG